MAKSKMTILSYQNQKKAEGEFPVPPAVLPLQSLVEIGPLDPKIGEEIDKLVFELANRNGIDEKQLNQDALQLKAITAQVKNIETQAVFLHGERIFRAREILRKYGDETSTFTSWVKIAYSHRSSAYNHLAFYMFHNALSTPDLQAKLKEMPQKAVYKLASRGGGIEQKVEILEKCYGMKAPEIIAMIDEKLPIKIKRESKKDINVSVIVSIAVSLKKINSRKHILSESNREMLASFRGMIDEILNTQEVVK